jgi:hypothetical protein
MVLPLALTVILTSLGEIPAGELPLYLTPRAKPGFVSSRAMSGSAQPFMHLKHVAVKPIEESKSVA